MDGQVFKLSAAMQGENAPPLHPRCRCTIAPEVEGTRLAGRKRIPAVSYSEWRKSVEKPLILGNGAAIEHFAAIKAAEDKAYAKVTGADFGFERAKSPAIWAKELLIVNEGTERLGRLTNCQRCVVAHEARMRGYDVKARPSWGNGDPIPNDGYWLKAFDYSPSEIRKCKGDTAIETIKSLEDIMKDFGTGARAVVWFKWKESSGLKGGHTIIAECGENGVVNVGDPQSKSRAAIYKLKLAQSDTVGVLRVDNLNFTELIKRCCMKRSECDEI